LRIRRLKLKINVVGERAVGKTSLIQRYVEARHTPEYKGTLGVHMHRVDVELPGDEPGDVILANIAIFDQMGEHAIRENFRDALFYGTQGALAVCDIERPDTLQTLAEWIRAVSAVTGGVPFRIVFNKVDRARLQDWACGIRLAQGQLPRRADVPDERGHRRRGRRSVRRDHRSSCRRVDGG